MYIALRSSGSQTYIKIDHMLTKISVFNFFSLSDFYDPCCALHHTMKLRDDWSDKEVQLSYVVYIRTAKWWSWGMCAVEKGGGKGGKNSSLPLCLALTK